VPAFPPEPSPTTPTRCCQHTLVYKKVTRFCLARHLWTSLYTLNEQGSLTLHIRWDGVITIQDTQHSGSIVMDADDYLDLVVARDAECDFRSVLRLDPSRDYARHFAQSNVCLFLKSDSSALLQRPSVAFQPQTS